VRSAASFFRIFKMRLPVRRGRLLEASIGN
jgi:hypothetical protein